LFSGAFILRVWGLTIPPLLSFFSRDLVHVFFFLKSPPRPYFVSAWPPPQAPTTGFFGGLWFDHPPNLPPPLLYLAATGPATNHSFPSLCLRCAKRFSFFLGWGRGYLLTFLFPPLPCDVPRLQPVYTSFSVSDLLKFVLQVVYVPFVMESTIHPRNSAHFSLLS